MRFTFVNLFYINTINTKPWEQFTDGVQGKITYSVLRVKVGKGKKLYIQNLNPDGQGNIIYFYWVVEAHRQGTDG